jgi:hypothetical protein
MNPDGTSPTTEDLAKRLHQYESALQSSSETVKPTTCVVCEKMRGSLSTLAGTAGYRSLLRRAVTLAKRQAPVFSAVQVNDDGSLADFDSTAAEESAVLIAQLLGLLNTFIGETLTLRLLHDIWPDLPGLEKSPEERKQT